MIISFEKDLFSTGKEEINLMLAEIIDFILEERCLIDFNECIETFYSENGEYHFNNIPFATDYLSNVNRSRLKDHIELLIQKDSYLTKIHIKYLSYCKVGMIEGYTNPRDCLKLFRERSVIIVENATNDWKFIKGIVEKYAKHKTRKSIYKLIQKSIDNDWLIAEQAGGYGQIIPRYLDLTNRVYKNIQKFKILVLFDSDRDNSDMLCEEQKTIIEYFKQKAIKNISEAYWEESDIILWHMLYKREIENYIPFLIVNDNIELDECTIDYTLNSKDYEFLDFIKYEKIFPKVKVKKIFPDLFLLSYTRDLLEDRCVHHKVDIEEPSGSIVAVSEIEQILLKIAKII